MTKNWKEKLRKLWSDYPRTEEENKQGLDVLIEDYIDSLLAEQKEELKKEIISIIEAEIKEEESLPAEDDTEKTAEWYKIQGFIKIKKLIEEL